jgi:dTDP-4-amino-4,6-dideoxygalactose transaminase
VVQHTYGIPADMERITQVAQWAGLSIIEDCCHTLASSYKGKTTGAFGAASFYSFEWGKPIVIGLGGSAVIHDPALRDRVREAYAHYKIPGAISQARIQLQYVAFKFLFRPSLYWPVRSLFHWLGSLGVAESNYNPIEEGNMAEDFGLRMSPALQRRLARKLPELDRLTQHSRWAASEYRSRIKSAAVSHPILSKDSDTVFARYPLLAQDKDTLLAAARKANVELSEWYATPIHPLSGKELTKVHYELGSCPNAEARCREIVTLPVHSAVRRQDIDRAVKFLDESAPS